MSPEYLIDTDGAVHYFKGRQAPVTRLNALENESLAISVATLAELYDGLYGSRNPRKREADLQDFLQGAAVFRPDEETWRQLASRIDAPVSPILPSSHRTLDVTRCTTSRLEYPRNNGPSLGTHL